MNPLLEKALFVLSCIGTGLLWLSVFVVASAAIFIDRSPAEGNLGGMAGLICVAAFAATFIIAWWSDER
jgi:hypothetical protein